MQHSAPLTTSAMTVEFLRTVAPGVAVPVHDAGLSAAGRALYLRNVGTLAPEGTRISDTGGRGVVEV